MIEGVVAVERSARWLPLRLGPPAAGALKRRQGAADVCGVAHAAAMHLRIRADRERPAPDAVVEWRFDELERMGVDALDALRAALEQTLDVHEVRLLVRRGCPPSLALRIAG